MQPITTEELKASLDANHDLKLLMVVGPWEFRARHIPGSVGYPSPRTALLELGRDDQIILYANNHYRGNTSAAAAALAAHGYRNVRIYRGGLVDWQAAGYPVEGNNVATGSRPRRPLWAPPTPARPARRLPSLRQRLVRVRLATAPAATAIPARHQQPTHPRAAA